MFAVKDLGEPFFLIYAAARSGSQNPKKMRRKDLNPVGPNMMGSMPLRL
jgi:hypothetical protein